MAKVNRKKTIFFKDKKRYLGSEKLFIITTTFSCLLYFSVSVSLSLSDTCLPGCLLVTLRIDWADVRTLITHIAPALNNNKEKTNTLAIKKNIKLTSPVINVSIVSARRRTEQKQPQASCVGVSQGVKKYNETLWQWVFFCVFFFVGFYSDYVLQASCNNNEKPDQSVLG